jgi:two-component system chemotaxis response regulator CheY
MQKRCVLIVDDSPTMRNLLVFALRRVQGLVFLEAQNGVEALELLGQHPIDIILLDLNMPVMSGFTFLEHFMLLEQKKTIPVVVITTEGSDEDFARAQVLGAKAYVTKPVQAARLAAVIKEVLETWGPGTAAPQESAPQE